MSCDSTRETNGKAKKVSYESDETAVEYSSERERSRV